MQADWKKLAVGEDLRVKANGIEVTFASGRRHFVLVSEQDDSFLLTGMVQEDSESQSQEDKDFIFHVWQRNRAVKIVGFRVNEEKAIIGETWVPLAGLSKQEFEFCVRTLAAECDRFEFALSGGDDRL